MRRASLDLAVHNFGIQEYMSPGPLTGEVFRTSYRVAAIERVAAEVPGVPVVPGASTVTEMMTLAERGVELMKFFPAEACGGVRFLSSVAAPLPNLRFCPTGGVTAASASSYLSLPSVVCVGGSWLTPPQLLATADWGKVTDLAAAAAGFRHQPTG